MDEDGISKKVFNMKTKEQDQIGKTSHDGKKALGWISHTRRNTGRTHWDEYHTQGGTREETEEEGNPAKGKRRIKRLGYQRDHVSVETS